MTAPNKPPNSPKQRLQARLQRLSPVRLLPEETRFHLRNMRREQLLVLRSLLDAAIARVDRDARKDEEARADHEARADREHLVDREARADREERNQP